MEKNPVLIFPSKNVQAWDHLPRFTFLDVDMKKVMNQPIVLSERHRKAFRSTFIGSPLRKRNQNGTQTQRVSKDEDQDQGFTQKASTISAPADNCKDSIALYAAMNEIGMAKMRDKVGLSASIALTKA